MTSELRYLLDINVLIALSWPQHVQHERAHAWFAAAAKRNWATTPVTEAGFVRVSSSSARIPGAVPVAAAIAAIAEMRASPGHSYLVDDSSLADPAIDISRMVTSKQVTDMHLVNLAARGGAVLATLDVAIPSYLAQAERRHVLVLP